jgi:hypothetical protein
MQLHYYKERESKSKREIRGRVGASEINQHK